MYIILDSVQCDKHNSCGWEVLAGCGVVPAEMLVQAEISDLRVFWDIGTQIVENHDKTGKVCASLMCAGSTTAAATSLQVVRWDR